MELSFLTEINWLSFLKIIAAISWPDFMVKAFVIWLLFGVVGSIVLYVGFGFVMNAQKARNDNKSQRKVILVDTCIAVPYIVLDALLNLFFYSFLCVDFRMKTTWCLVTERLSIYSEDPTTGRYHKFIANFIAAFLDGKDPSGDHIKGDNFKFKWLD